MSILSGLTPHHMKSIFYLVVSLAVLVWFFPTIADKLQSVLMLLLDLAAKVLAHAGA